MNKRDIFQMIEKMPDEVDIDELMDQLYILKRIQVAEQEWDEGRFITHEEFVRRSEEWQK